MLRRIFVLALAPTLALAACGSDGGSSADPAEDRAAVKAAIASFEAELKDAGFAVDPDADDDEDDDLEFTSAECKGLDKAFSEDKLPGETADKESRPFTRGEFDGVGGVQESVQGSAGLVGEPTDLDPIFEVMHDERMEGCMKDALEEELSKEADGEAVTVTNLKVDVQDLDAVGDEASLLHVAASIELSGLEFPFVIDMGLARQERAAATVLVTTIGSKAAKTKVPHLLESMLDDLGSVA